MLTKQSHGVLVNGKERDTNSPTRSAALACLRDRRSSSTHTSFNDRIEPSSPLTVHATFASRCPSSPTAHTPKPGSRPSFPHSMGRLGPLRTSYGDHRRPSGAKHHHGRCNSTSSAPPVLRGQGTKAYRCLGFYKSRRFRHLRVSLEDASVGTPEFCP